MKKLLFIFLIVLPCFLFAEATFDQKAENLALEYQTALNLSNAEMLNAKADILLFMEQEAGGSVTVNARNTYNNIVNAIEGVSNFPLTSGIQNYNGTITTGSTIARGPCCANNVHLGSCTTNAAISNGAKYFEIIPVIVTQSGVFNLSVNTGDISDMYMALYCENFDENFPTQNIIAYDDDSGIGNLPSISSISLNEGNYYIVATPYSDGSTTTYTVELSAISGSIYFGSTVPVNYWWIAGLFLLIGIGIVGKRFFF
ncbi:MAG: hypothetical protein PF541_12425 [Prolixibacteraceae bacterium]|jgi:hypothetical protein|nr:hypothetical protein [Prolixibacteraceae bacterium]